jgi:hypothetical protein
MHVRADKDVITVAICEPVRIGVHCQGYPSSDGAVVDFHADGGWATIHLTPEQVVELRGKLADDQVDSAGMSG